MNVDSQPSMKRVVASLLVVLGTCTGTSGNVASGAILRQPSDVAQHRAQNTNYVIGDPLLLDPANGDFHLQEGNPTIDNSLYVGLPYQGVAPDIGACESPQGGASATVYYVAANEPGASDANNGLYPTYQGEQDGPWLTIQHAASTMTAGDTAYVRAGTYYESAISFAHSGAPGVPITLTNYQSEEVIIDGQGSTDVVPGIWIVEGRDHYVIQGLTIRNMLWSGIETNGNTTDPYRDITIAGHEHHRPHNLRLGGRGLLERWERSGVALERHATSFRA